LLRVKGSLGKECDGFSGARRIPKICRQPSPESSVQGSGCNRSGGHEGIVRSRSLSSNFSQLQHFLTTISSEWLVSGSLPYNQLAMHHHPVPWKRAQVRVDSRCSRRYKVDRRHRSRFDNVGVSDHGVAPDVELRIAGCRELRFANKSKSIKASCIGSVRSPAVRA